MKKDLLKEYKRKRNFKLTKEPKGTKGTKKKSRLTFVVQEHHARRLHYDFRLEWDGVLKSWAIPKGPSDDPEEKRLAVQTEDHPLSYGKFHGTIPEGEYGAGEVYIWDKGLWEPEEDIEEGFKKGHLIFSLKGKKLKGTWHLVKMKGQPSKQENWLLIKKKTESWPGFIPPQLPRLVSEVPEGENWIHELKLDGHRMQAHIHNGEVQIFTRNELDWSKYFPNIVKSLKALKISNAIIDGEIVALNEKGHFDFQKLQNTIKTRDDTELRYYVFDLLFLNGADQRSLSLFERKKNLKKIISSKNKIIKFNEIIETSGTDFFDLTCEMNLEGVVSKLRDSTYHSGRNDLWMKIKCKQRQEFIIGGYTDTQGERIGLGALLLGVYEKGKLRYVGKVGTGFSHETLKTLYGQLKKIETNQSPFDIKSPKGKGIHWVNPSLIGEVEFSQWTHDKILRHAVYKGLRSDKNTKEIHMEISSPNKILYKKEKMTKSDVLNYYQKISKHMIPFIKDRPLSLVRCPEGTSKKCFFQKHLKENEEFSSLDSLRGIEELVQLNAFEIHVWNCRRQKLMNPDQFVMDLDPGDGVSWKEVIEAAFELKKLLEELNLKSFVKLTGGKGIHLHIPIAPIYDWDQVKAFTQTIALQLVEMHPDRYIAKMSKSKRKGKIFIDYLRNGYGATAVAPYSLRAKEISSVALPLSWQELRRIKGPQEYTLKNVLKKIRARKTDPWKNMIKLKQKIKILKATKK